MNKFIIYGIRFAVILLWLFLTILMLRKDVAGTVALILLIFLHAFEVFKYGLAFGMKQNHSKIYSLFMTFIFGVTWFKMPLLKS